MLTLPFLPFLAGGIIGALVLGIFTEWALLIISSLLGADYLARALPPSPNARLLLGSGLFIVGALTQANLMKMEQRE